MHDASASLAQTRRGARVVAFSNLLIAAAVLVACTDTNTTSQSTDSVVTPVSVVESDEGSGTRYSLDDLGVRFELQENFVVAQDNEVEFLARSSAPPAIFSIDSAAGDVTNYEGEEGESVRSIALGDVNALVVSNAVLEGLPPGIAANELLVDTEAQSFSVIMSAAPGDLVDLWDPFIASIRVEND